MASTRPISEILAVKDYTELTHDEISQLIDYRCEQAIKRAVAEDRENGRKSANAERRKALEDTLAALKAVKYEPPVIKEVRYG